MEVEEVSGGRLSLLGHLSGESGWVLLFWFVLFFSVHLSDD